MLLVMTPLGQRMQMILQWMGETPTKPMSMREFARKAGLKSESHIGAIVQKGITPRLDVAIAICRAANVSLDWFATGTGNPHGHLGMSPEDVRRMLEKAAENLGKKKRSAT